MRRAPRRWRSAQRRPRAGAGQRRDLSPDRRRRAGQAQGRLRRWRSCCRRASIRRSRSRSNEHPAILATQHLVDAAAFSVKSAEGALLPQLSASAGVSDDYRNVIPDLTGTQRQFDLGQYRRDADHSDLFGRPDLGAWCGRTRNRSGEARIEVDVSRDQVAPGRHLGMVAIHRRTGERRRQQAGDRRRATGAERRHRRAQCRPAHHARRAQRAGRPSSPPRSIWPIPNTTWWWRAMPSCRRWAACRSTGSGLQVTKYKPEEHYNAVKDKWIGLRTPDGR